VANGSGGTVAGEAFGFGVVVAGGCGWGDKPGRAGVPNTGGGDGMLEGEGVVTGMVGKSSTSIVRNAGRTGG